MNDAADLTHFEVGAAITRLEGMTTFLAEALDAVPADELALRPAAGEFSMVEHACHLRDLEREGYLVRVRRILAETLPQLEGFDGTAVASARNYMAQDARIAAQEFAAARREVLALLAAATPGELAREATFDGPRITLRQLVAMMASHDAAHREEIGRLIEALEEL